MAASFLHQVVATGLVALVQPPFDPFARQVALGSAELPRFVPQSAVDRAGQFDSKRLHNAAKLTPRCQQSNTDERQAELAEDAGLILA